MTDDVHRAIPLVRCDWRGQLLLGGSRPVGAGRFRAGWGCCRRGRPPRSCHCRSCPKRRSGFGRPPLRPDRSGAQLMAASALFSPAAIGPVVKYLFDLRVGLVYRDAGGQPARGRVVAPEDGFDVQRWNRNRTTREWARAVPVALAAVCVAVVFGGAAGETPSPHCP